MRTKLDSLVVLSNVKNTVQVGIESDLDPREVTECVRGGMLVFELVESAEKSTCFRVRRSNPPCVMLDKREAGLLTGYVALWHLP